MSATMLLGNSLPLGLMKGVRPDTNYVAHDIIQAHSYEWIISQLGCRILAKSETLSM